MPKAKLESDGLSQAERFERAAREHQADEDERRWEERLKRVAKQKREKRP
jgi:hypothetical protein